MPDRFQRQADLVPRERLADLTATVIGVGAVGRPLALQLAGIGVRRLQLIDPDDVEPHNVTTQGYLAQDVGGPKVTATGNAAAKLDPTVNVKLVPDRFRSRYRVEGPVFCCVDAITGRRAIWRHAQRESFFCDARMLGEVIRVLTVADAAGRAHYPTTLFPASEAQRGRCTARSTIYAAQVAAGLLVHQFTRWLRGLPVDRDLSLNLLASELSVT